MWQIFDPEPVSRARIATLAVTPIICLAVLAVADIDPGHAQTRVSPQLRIEQPADRKRRHHKPPAPSPYRTFDGSGNNLDDPDVGAALTPLLRYAPSDYADGVSALAGPHRPGPREISNAVVSQDGPIPNTLGASDYLWQWGQFVDHDIDLTEGTDPPEPANIPIPSGDPYFDPDDTGIQQFAFNRSIYDTNTGTGKRNPRQQLNELSAWIDASNVYGSDSERAAALRTNDGTGRLRTSAGNLLPFNDTVPPLPNAGGSSADLFVAGDVRANEQVGLTALHTLFVREHNRLAAAIALNNGRLSGEKIFQRARKIVGAQMQVITYREFLPALLGENVLSRYRGYDRSVDGGIGNVFSTAAYRFGHSLLSPTLLRLNANGKEIGKGHLPLRDAFFAPHRLTDEGGIEPLLRGLAAQPCQALDPFIVDDVRNFLFGAPGEGGFDLASLNIQRGRDHGLPGYKAVRKAFGLRRARSFRDVSSRREIRSRLHIYANVDDIDVWVGGLAEDPVRGGHVGALLRAIIKRQFEALRDGDRYWYKLTFSRRMVDELERTTLADIIRRNTNIGNEISDNVFQIRRRRR